ncbi:MAG TPA: diguanylate cyclase [Steroidobacteraceae bacterium]|nr:diguanylate cyclase [Steroidobacteraceae bacterium]
MSNRICSLLCCAIFLLAAAPMGIRAQTIAHPAQDLVEQSVRGMRADPDASEEMARRALELLAREPNADLELRARLVLCDYLAERDRAGAEQQAALALALLPQAVRKGLAAGVLGCQGEILETAGENAQARLLYEQAVAAATEAADDEMLAGALYLRGYLLGLAGDYAPGLADLERAKSIYDMLAMPDHALTALGGIAILYNRLGDYAEARRIYTQTLKAQQSAGLEREQAVTLHNLGRAHENLGEWGAAGQAFGAALEISRRIGYVRGQAYALRGLASVANAREEPREALRLLARAQAYQRQTPDARLRARIDLARGIALRKIGRYESSIAALQDARRIFRDADAKAELAETHQALAAVHADAGNWRKAYESYRAFKNTSDGLLNQQLDQRFATLKVQFDTAARDQENSLLMRENEATERALAQERRANHLQAIVIGLVVVLAVLLATLVVRARRTNRQLRALAMTDELTGVPNRRAVLRQVDQMLADATRRPCSILIIDIDHFKQINDTHGHPVGDQVLQIVAAELRAAVHPPATLGRLGGEEFIVVLPSTDAMHATLSAERIRERLMAIDLSDCFVGRITASIGIATDTNLGDTTRELLRRADRALYEAKHSGRNCVRSAA